MKIDEDYVRDKSFINKEIANAVTHGLGAVIFMVAIPVLLAYSAMYAKAQFTWSVAIFGFGISDGLYVIDVVSWHTARERQKRHLRIIDHISIFILIGGSYTPIVLACLPREKAITFLAILWTLIVAGAIGKLFFTGRYRLVFHTVLFS
jgi:hemolysin III